MISRSQITGQMMPLPDRPVGTVIPVKVVDVLTTDRIVSVVHQNRDNVDEMFIVIYRPGVSMAEIGQLGTLTFVKGSVGNYWQWQANPPESLPQPDSSAIRNPPSAIPEHPAP